MNAPDSMRLLWIGTKPPLPTIDGGRLAAAETLRALTGVGVNVELVAPLLPSGPVPTDPDLTTICRPHLVPVRPPHLTTTIRRTVRAPFSIARHWHRAVRERIAELLAIKSFDAVHVEQVQAFAQASSAADLGLPVVLRAQNVESDLWRRSAPWAPWEAQRLRTYERRAMKSAAVSIALSARDAERLREIGAGGTEIVTVPPPFPAILPMGERRLDGEPPLVLMGSAGWRPNRDATRWFVNRCWPQVSARVPQALLHVFAAESDRPAARQGVVFHQPPERSADAFAHGAILVVPLRVASGVRMKILEAWARGAPVIATPEAVGGLDAREGQEVLLANDAAGFAEAIQRLSGDGELRRRLVTGGRQALIDHHDPRTVAERLVSIYRFVAGR